jgi:glycosyltransferase involved in cell wall biosynthesis
MSQPLVTIGVTCFNAEATIGRAIRSALAQDWPNIEILIVDDCSTDGSREAAAEAIAGHDHARLIRQPKNTGPAGARNTILREAKGEFVAFFDDDDESFPDRIAVQVRAIEDYERRTGASLVACFASGSRRYDSGHVAQLDAIGSRGAEAPNGPDVAAYLLVYDRNPDWFYGSGTPACSMMARRSTFAAAGDFDASLRRVEDMDFAVRLALLGGHFIGTKERLFLQYATTGADKSADTNCRAEQALAEKNRAFLQSIGGYYHAHRWPRLRFWHFTRNYPRFALELVGLFLRNPVRTIVHLAATGPKRLRHERRIFAG